MSNAWSREKNRSLGAGFVRWLALMVLIASADWAKCDVLDPGAFTLAADEGAAASRGEGTEDASIRVNVERINSGLGPFQIRLLHPGLPLKEGVEYALTFRARADEARPISVAVSAASGDRSKSVYDGGFKLGPDWRDYRATFKSTEAVASAQVRFALGASNVDVELADVTLDVADSASAGFIPPSKMKLSVRNSCKAKLSTPPELPDVARVVIDKIDPEPAAWHVNLAIPRLAIEENQAYVLTYRVRSSKPREYVFTIAMDHPPWTSLGFDKTLGADRNWKTVTTRFRGKLTESKAEIRIGLGKGTGTIEFSHLRLEKAPSPPANFMDPTDFVLSVYGDNRAELGYSADDANVMKIDVGKVTIDRMPWKVSVQRRRLAIRKGETYELKFRARARGPRAILLGIDMAHPPWKNLGLGQSVVLNNEWTNLQYTFEATESDDDGQIRFDLGNSDTDVEIADIALDLVSTDRETPNQRRPMVVNLVGMSVWIVVGLALLWRAKLTTTK